VLAGGVIPGNEKSIAKIINKFFNKGAKVLYRGLSDVHVSGHGNVEDLKFMLSITIEIFYANSWELRMLFRHAEIALELESRKLIFLYRRMEIY